MLAILIKRAKEKGQITGVIPYLVDDGMSICNMLMTQFSLWITIWTGQIT
jgi:hypothetical protein